MWQQKETNQAEWQHGRQGVPITAGRTSQAHHHFGLSIYGFGQLFWCRNRNRVGSGISVDITLSGHLNDYHRRKADWGKWNCDAGAAAEPFKKQLYGILRYEDTQAVGTMDKLVEKPVDYFIISHPLSY